MTISAPILASSLAKSGSGNLTVGAIDLSAATGPRAIAANAGTLTLTSPVTSGTLSTTNTLTYQVSRGATLNATATGLTLGANQILQGGGTQTSGAGNTATVIGTVTVANGGTIRPSALGGSSASLASPGVLNIDGNVVFQAGGTYEWAINSVLGANTEAGTTTDYTQSLLNATGSLDLTGLSSANKFTLKVTALSLGNAIGSVSDFDGQTYTATIATFAGGIGGFAADKFDLQYNTADFGGTSLTLSQSGNSLVVNINPVPEPTAVLAVAAAFLGGIVAIRRRKTLTRV